MKLKWEGLWTLIWIGEDQPCKLTHVVIGNNNSFFYFSQSKDLIDMFSI